VNWRVVSERYFSALQAPLLAGRHFTEGDDATRPRVAIVNRTLARLYFPGQNPVGQRFGDTSLSPASIKEIVGVVEDVREGPLDSDIWPAVYYPYRQAPDASFELVVRAAGDPAALLPAIDAAARDVDGGIVTLALTTMESRISRSPSAYLHRSTAVVAAGFAGLAWLLGAVGLYSVMAFLVAQRTREIGVRMALGAERGSVSRMVMAQAGRLAAIGLAGGLVLGVGTARLISDLLFGTPPWDVPAFAIAVAALVASSVVAAWIPARRAASIDPIEALRAE
jgi:predicted permease